MMEGTFGSKGELLFEIDLIAVDGLHLPVDAMLDTGFTEFMAINKQDVEGLEWSSMGQEELRTAQGETSFDLYLGKVLLDGKEFEIPVFAGNEIQEILLGSRWLMMLPLVVNYREGVLRLGN